MTHIDAGTDAVDEPSGPRWLRGWAGLASLAAAFLVILLLRRGQQVVSPQVWAEDGSLVFKGLLDDGVASLVAAEPGYMILAPRLVAWASLGTSVSLHPHISTILAWLFSLGVLLLVARGPSKLAGGPLLALGVLLVPTDAEVFGIPLYTCWWSGLLIFAAIFWDERARHLPARAAGVVLGGLSSPLIVMAVPLFWVRAVVYRRQWREWVLAGVATLCAGLQFLHLRVNRPVSGTGLTAGAIDEIVTKFFGHFAVGELRPTLADIAGAVVLVLAGLVVWQRRKVLSTWLLVYLLVGSIGMSVARMPIEKIVPVHAGARYFFFPSMLLSWLFLQAARCPSVPTWLRGAAWSVVLVAVLNSLPHFGRTHDDLDWQGHVASSVDFDRYCIPVEANGQACRHWLVAVSGERMASAVSRDPLAGWNHRTTPYPYTAVAFERTARKSAMVSRGVVEAGAWQEPGTADDPCPGLVVLRSPELPAERRLTFVASRGDRVLMRSSAGAHAITVTIAGSEDRFATAVLPALRWRWLEFSSRRLPETFTVVVEERGGETGQWVEVAFAP